MCFPLNIFKSKYFQWRLVSVWEAHLSSSFNYTGICIYKAEVTKGKGIYSQVCPSSIMETCTSVKVVETEVTHSLMLDGVLDTLLWLACGAVSDFTDPPGIKGIYTEMWSYWFDEYFIPLFKNHFYYVYFWSTLTKSGITINVTVHNTHSISNIQLFRKMWMTNQSLAHHKGI